MRIKAPFIEIMQHMLGNIPSIHHEGNISGRNYLIFDQIANSLNFVRDNSFT